MKRTRINFGWIFIIVIGVGLAGGLPPAQAEPVSIPYVSTNGPAAPP